VNRRYGVGSLLVAASVGACSSSSPGPDAGTTGGQLSPCPSYANTLCNLYSDCSAGWTITSQYGTLANCVSRNAFACGESLAVAGTSLTSADVSACTSELPAESCARLYGPEGTGVCAPAGTGAENLACEVSAQCGSGLCEVPGNSFCGTCQAGAKQGESCSTGPCAPGLLCLAGVQTCSPPVTDGGECRADADCQFGFTCLSSLSFCAPAAAAGMACDPTHQAGPGCNADLGLVCQPVENGDVCQQEMLAQAGQPCGSPTAGAVPTVCANRGVCQKAADAGVGVCLGVAGDGAACDTASGPSCELPARCIVAPDAGTAGTCQLLSTTLCGSNAGN